MLGDFRIDPKHVFWRLGEDVGVLCQEIDKLDLILSWECRSNLYVPVQSAFVEGDFQYFLDGLGIRWYFNRILGVD